MLEGLAVWALFIYILRLVGLPWNLYSKLFAYVGGGAWLLFVWAGLLNYTPMDLSGGSVVQSPHIQLRPANTQITGEVEEIFVKPNQTVEKGQLIYKLDDDRYQVALNKAEVALNSAIVAEQVADEDVKLAQQRLEASASDITISQNQLDAEQQDLKYKELTLNRYRKQNEALQDSVTESQLDRQVSLVEIAKADLDALEAQLEKAKLAAKTAEMDLEKAYLDRKSRVADIDTAEENLAQAKWDLEHTKIYAPEDGYLTNFLLREGQFVGAAPRMQMYTNEKYVLMRVNHQAIRNIKVGQKAEFASAVYPGQIFSAEVEGIIEATGESQGSLLAKEDSVRQVTGKNVSNKHHFVRLKLEENEGHDIPVGSVGLAWVSGAKPIEFMNFLDVIRGLIIRMKSQIYYFYSL